MIYNLKNPYADQTEKNDSMIKIKCKDVMYSMRSVPPNLHRCPKVTTGILHHMTYGPESIQKFVLNNYYLNLKDYCQNNCGDK